jgi:hypothetical protein
MPIRRSWAINCYSVDQEIPSELLSFWTLSIVQYSKKLELAKTLNHITFLMRCKSQGIIPKGFSIKTPINSRRSSNIVQRASKALVRDRIHFHWHNNVTCMLYTIWHVLTVAMATNTHNNGQSRNSGSVFFVVRSGDVIRCFLWGPFTGYIALAFMGQLQLRGQFQQVVIR